MNPRILLVITTETRFGLGKGHAFEWFEKAANCDKVIYATPAEALPHLLRGGVSAVIILGQQAFSLFYPDVSLDNFRGSYLPLFKTHFPSLPVTASFHPQDADDLISKESEDETVTQPANYRFWICSDVQKVLNKPLKTYKDEIVLAPVLKDAIAYISSATKDDTIYLDIETRRGDWSLNCIGFAINDGPVYVVPVYNYDHNIFYGNFLDFFVPFIRKMSVCRIVVHNALFDLYILSKYYKLPCSSNIYDTMLAHHRCFPEVEKSLAHAISYWTWRDYHKDMNIENPLSYEQQYAQWKYNALDVAGMRDVEREQKEYIKADSGLFDSVAQANSSIYPYLCTMLNGIAYNRAKLLENRRKSANRLAGLERVAKILTGIPSFNPNSAAQAIGYFHNRLKYKVMGRTPGGKPALGQKELAKLRVRYPNNPLIPVIIEARLTKKNLSMLEFYET